ncbi:type III secretion system chaperone [Pseudothauera rhizosphaerae]|uniref:Type III secretion system chaperone n=1 Tax=Pseudothauera rhizosphaerae TaxID=2565932 RepID=A0A4S4AVP7_9RHOO|nr:type III secretion system chaperone [Pseudothauera rhizosphaerae]THF64112.1 type III secretion system chaperone [Pseudothauera rhizosphaerae]
MTELHALAEAVAGLAHLDALPAELADGTPFHARLADGRGVGVAFNGHTGGWVLSADGAIGTLAPDEQAALREALLRRSFDARHTTAVIGATAGNGRLSLAVHCAALPADPAQAEAVFERLLRELDGLAREPGAAAQTAAARDSAQQDALPANWLRV